MLALLFKHFFILGCISFGGPAAHLGYFRKRFVEQLNWLSDDEYAQIVALSQFLPGPGSSQTGFAIGYQKAGLEGGIAAFVGFTAPSVVLMLLLASFGSTLVGHSWYNGVVHGLKLLAVVIVADATFGMYKSFCQDRLSQSIFTVSAIATLLMTSLIGQLLTLSVCGLIGAVWLRGQTVSTTADTARQPRSSKPLLLPLLLFTALFFILPILSQQPQQPPIAQLSAVFFGAGSLVFGGGHVVLPMLQGMLGGNISNDVFLSGYAAAQAVPGPMFTLATWLGFHLTPDSPIAGALLATIMIFLPGFLLLTAFLPSWQTLAKHPNLQGAILGINACVTGLLLAALYNPVFSSAVVESVDFCLVTAGFWLLRTMKMPVPGLVVFFVFSGIIFYG